MNTFIGLPFYGKGAVDLTNYSKKKLPINLMVINCSVMHNDGLINYGMNKLFNLYFVISGGILMLE